jgi:hypothetical protein
MNIFSISFRTVQQFPAAVALYAAANAGIAFVVVGINMLLGFPADEGAVLTNVEKTYMFGTDLFVATATAATQCLAFAVLGKAIDRPVWRIGGPVEALQRFFTLWFGLNLVQVAIIRVQVAAYSIWGQGGPGTFLWGLVFASSIIAIPFGAAVMFHGKLVWSELSEAMQPIFRFGSQVTALCIATLAVLIAILSMRQTALETPWIQPGLHIIFALWQCVVFTGIWLLCITNRESPMEDDDFDF